ncbi:MAG: hypothetical protein ABW007_22085, partial [Chitinophagaceae bacterium]
MMMTRSDEISALYLAMRLIRHKVDVTTVQPAQTNYHLWLESSPDEARYAMTVIQEIQLLEQVPLQNLDEARSDFHLHSLADSIERLVASELAEEGYDDAALGERLLDNLRFSALENITQDQITSNIIDADQDAEVPNRAILPQQFEQQGFMSPQGFIYTSSKNVGKRHGRFVAQPFERGFGTTIGNSLRRALLSSIEGAAITAVKIEGVEHEFSSIRGVVEDATDVILNLKQIPFKLNSTEAKTL